MDRVSTYHKILRSSATIVALVLLFQSGVASQSTKLFSLQTESYLASVVGITATVPENELNVITAELEQRKNELDERERNLNQLGKTSLDDRTTFLLATTLFVLLVLIVLNYVMDIARNRRTIRPVSTQS